MDTMTEKDWVTEVGKPAYASIAEMVSALELDWDKLEELRDARDDWDAEENDGKSWADCNPDEAEELAELEKNAGECPDQDDARERIERDALSVEVRSGWVSVGDDMQAEEFCILLATGGPAVRIRGELNQYGEPSRAWLEVQDWYKPWTQYIPASQDTLLSYAQCFCFAS